jgi:hypothetical protein
VFDHPSAEENERNICALSVFALASDLSPTIKTVLVVRSSSHSSPFTDRGGIGPPFAPKSQRSVPWLVLTQAARTASQRFWIQ